MKVLVTGAAGFLGFHVAARLMTAGVDVIGVDALLDDGTLDLKRRRLGELASLGETTETHLSFAPSDLAEPGEIDGVIEATRPDRVIHLAGRAGVRVEHGAALLTRDNVLGTAALLDACAAHGVKSVVIGSSSSVYGNADPLPVTEASPADRPLGDYAASKRAAEVVAAGFVARTGIPVAVVRMFTVYGPWGRPDMAVWRFARAIEAGEPVKLYGTDRARDFTYVSDVVDGLLHALVQAPTGTWNLCRGRPVPVHRVIELIAQHLGRIAVVEAHPPNPVDPAVTWGDPSAFGRDIGFVPQVDVEDGIARFVQWWRSLDEG